jgi:hypothetical protein
MIESNGSIPARRRFLRGVFRNVSLTLLGVAAGATVAKRRRLVREGKCLNQGVCSGCEVFDECGLPRALSAKLAMTRSPDGG